MEAIKASADSPLAGADFVKSVVSSMEKLIVGQTYLIERLLVAMLANGHILLEGVPGLAKTTVVKTLAGLMAASFKRIQFTPDLLPADLIGTLIYHPHDGVFLPKKGPLFANIVLADEVNRAPAKVHSALLEAMEERQVTIGDATYPMAELFMVLATQNPIEQEGTYSLPEAQLDRFMMKVAISYPEWHEEREIIRRAARLTPPPPLEPFFAPDDLLQVRKEVESVYLDPKIEQYLLDIVFATRDLSRCGLGKYQRYLQFGASPRGSINLAAASRALAVIRGRDYVVPQDIKELAPDVLRHRIIMGYQADVDDVSADDLLAEILGSVKVP